MRRPCIEGLTAVIDYTAGTRAPDTALSVPRTGVVACRRVIGREYTHRTCAALGGRPRDIDPGSRESGNQPVATCVIERTSAADIVSYFVPLSFLYGGRSETGRAVADPPTKESQGAGEVALHKLSHVRSRPGSRHSVVVVVILVNFWCPGYVPQFLEF